MGVGRVFPRLSLSKADPVDPSHRSPFASNVSLADGIVMVHGRGHVVDSTLRTQGDPRTHQSLPIGMCGRPWRRARDISHLGLGATASTNRRRPPCRGADGKEARASAVTLHLLADELHVHVRTLRAAARDGRLAATFNPRPCFGKLTATATREAGARFMATWYRRTYGRGRRRLVAVCRVIVPKNYAATLVVLRHRLGLSQQQLAARIGAASKAVVYQWESGKRRPSPVFWLRIERLRSQLAK
jgi:DNA-binding XRE family transcriptional regulator